MSASKRVPAAARRRLTECMHGVSFEATCEKCGAVSDALAMLPAAPGKTRVIVGGEPSQLRGKHIKIPDLFVMDEGEALEPGIIGSAHAHMAKYPQMPASRIMAGLLAEIDALRKQVAGA